jgi:hypothetical protein
MTERLDLTYDMFITLAEQQGLQMDNPHLEELFSEVQAMFRRMKLLDQVDTFGIQTGSGSIHADTITTE